MIREVEKSSSLFTYLDNNFYWFIILVDRDNEWLILVSDKILLEVPNGLW